MRNLFTCIMIFMHLGLAAQEVSLRVELSTDSLLLGNYMEVRFTIENAAGDFNAPDFEGFEILSGPNTSSSFSMINGNVTQKASYTYVIRPLREGMIYVEPASFSMKDEVLETEPIGVMVYPNPAGIEENKLFRNMDGDWQDYFPKVQPGKKRKPFEKDKRKI